MDHRRIVAATLVLGVYMMERNRDKDDYTRQAPPLWKSIGIKPNNVLIDSDNRSIFGAIYEFTFAETHASGDPDKCPPRYVVAFRGTITDRHNWKRDLELDRRIITNSLKKDRRFPVALQAAREVADKGGSVWLAGHSLGSSIALIVGRQLIKDHGIHLDSYLFNPPFPSSHVVSLFSDDYKFALMYGKDVFRAGFAKLTTKADHFTELSSWVPNMFINPSDLICSEYIDYFHHREKMDGKGATARKINRIGTQNSGKSLVASVFRMEKGREAAHLIPTARLIINGNPLKNIYKDHGIRQWLNQDLQCSDREYKWQVYTE